MRHANIETTESYYVDLDADDESSELWRQFRNAETADAPTSGQEADETADAG